VSRRRSTAALLGPAVAVTLLLAGVTACGDDDSGGSGEGSGAETTSGGEPIGPADEGIEGVEAFEIASTEHTTADLVYDPRPPAGGEHNPTPATCGFYETDPPPDQHIVHSLEHGAVWVAYDPGIDDAEKATLRQLVETQPKTMATPYDDLESPLVVTAWARQLQLDSADDPRLVQFVEQYRAAGQSPEPDAACAGFGVPAVLAPVG
jgi:Protein of unknown function (DUF3105)